MGIHFPYMGLPLLFGPYIEWEIDFKSRVVMCLGLDCRLDGLLMARTDMAHCIKIHRQKFCLIKLFL
jgi:hypothetical protein